MMRMYSTLTHTPSTRLGSSENRTVSPAVLLMRHQYTGGREAEPPARPGQLRVTALVGERVVREWTLDLELSHSSGGKVERRGPLGPLHAIPGDNGVIHTPRRRGEVHVAVVREGGERLADGL